MALVSGANSRELSGPKNSCRQDSKAIALPEMAGVIWGVVTVYLHRYLTFIWLSPAGFSVPPNYYYWESCINYYVPKCMSRQVHRLWMAKQIPKGSSFVLPFLRLIFIFKHRIKISPVHPIWGRREKAPGSSLPVFSLFQSSTQIFQLMGRSLLLVHLLEQP